MPSSFSHIAVPAVMYVAFRSKAFNWRLLLLAVLVSVLPDADVIAFKYGIPYESQWGHRGFTHSITFSVLLAAFLAIFYKFIKSKPLTVFVVCFLSGISHALLDTLTNGGLGVALYWPFSHERILSDFRPIQASPIGVGRFFSERGVRVIISELQWVILPSAVIGIAAYFIRKAKNPKK